MTALVLGRNGSGKSVFAERLACSLAEGPLIYIATMIPFGEEGRRRVQKHKEQRSGYGFVTIEEPYSLEGIVPEPGAAVLLEDVSNLLSNAVFEKRRTPKSVLDEIAALSGRCESLVIVSIDGLSIDDGENDETREYIRALCEINCELSELADKTYRMEYGIPREV